MTSRKMNQQVLDFLLDDYEEKQVNAKYENTFLFNILNTPQQKISQILNERWDDQNVHNDLSDFCMYINNFAKRFDSVTAYRTYLNVLKVLGAGVQGTVSSLTLQDKDEISQKTPAKTREPLVAVKNISNPNNKNGKRELIAEFFIGDTLRSLFSQTPIFSQNYGLISCSKVVFDNTNVPIGFCMKNLPFSLITQYVPGKLIRDWLGVLTIKQYYKIVAILLDGFLKAAPLKFNHHDLHPGNVLIIQLNSPIAIPCFDTYVVTDLVPILIDYGLSTIETTRGKIFPSGLDEHNINGRYKPTYDIYKFISGTLYEGPKLFEEAKWLAKFFVPDLQVIEQLTPIIKNEHGDYPDLNLPFKYNNLLLEDYVEYFLDNLPFHIFSPDPVGYRIYAQYPNSQGLGIDKINLGPMTHPIQWIVLENDSRKRNYASQIISLLKKYNDKQIIKTEDYQYQIIGNVNLLHSADLPGKVIALDIISELCLQLQEGYMILEYCNKNGQLGLDFSILRTKLMNLNDSLESARQIEGSLSKSKTDFKKKDDLLSIHGPRIDV